MKNLDDFIVQNRALFDGDELPQGHEERFFAKLKGRQRRRVRLHPSRFRLWNMAAAAVIVLLAGWGVAEFVQSKTASEARMFRQYQRQIGVLQEKLDGYVATLSTVDQEQIEGTIELFTENADEFTALLPPELPVEQRREALKAYYAQRVAGMEQTVALVMEYANY